MAMIRINHRRVTKDQLAVNVLGISWWGCLRCSV